MTVLYTEKLAMAAERHDSLLCFGLDPVLEKIPSSIKGSPRERIVKFYSTIIDSIPENPGISALKPNYAFFAQYGWDGLQAMQDLIYRYYGRYPVILDVKRGDIGTTSAAYAKECYDFWGADAVTLSPFMGHDSVKPFIDRFGEGRGAYLLCRTSNAGAADFQELTVKESKRSLYLEVLDKALQWHADGLGLVVGATAPVELEAVLKAISKKGQPTPLLIPGVGTQGGSPEEVGRILCALDHSHLGLHRINASSSIAYGYLKANVSDHVEAALNEIARINRALDCRL
ncbi:Orotidine 5'-phosphate decarboxylase [uncultured archaeon]|nr:Orotidine 5'-phosphate decarboxylase [uncultured archaeon]